MIRPLLTTILCLLVTIGHAMSVKEKHIYGYVEKVYIPALKTSLKAKLDTGANSSSLSAVNIQETEEGDTTYLTFTVPFKTGSVTLKKPLVGEVKIKSRAGENLKKTNGKPKPKPIHRPVIKLLVKLGSETRDIDVNLTNRKRFNYPLLLGRRALIQFDSIIDPSEVFLADSKEKK